MNRDKFPHLSNLMGAYFHQDWDLEFSTYQEVLAYFINVTFEEDRIKTIKELKELLSLNLDEEQLHDFLVNELHCDYSPLPELSHTEWLLEVLKTIEGSILKK